MDGANLPELLARDLTLSEDVFKERHMTSGAPAPTLATYIGKGTYTLSAPNGANVRAYGYLGGTQGHVLGAIWEQHYTDRIAALQNHSRSFDELSETSSFETTPANSPLSPRYRGESIATVATSIRSPSNRFSEASTKTLTKPERIKSGVFLDFGDGDGSDSETIGEDCITSRPVVSRGDSGIEVPPASPSILDHGVLDPPPNIRRTSRPNPTILIPSRSASIRRRSIADSEASSLSPLTKRSPRISIRPDMSSPSRRPSIAEAPMSPGSLTVPSLAEARASSGKPPLRIELPTADVNAFPRLSPFSPAASVQTWLDTNIVHSPMPHESDAAAPEDVPFGITGLPLPQSVLNTLKISTLYFPETMLLSSSLSIETIRSYARKLRQPPENGDGSPPGMCASQNTSRAPSPWSPPPSPPEQHKKSFWPTVFHRRGSQHRAQRDPRCFTSGDKYFELPPSQTPNCHGGPGGTIQGQAAVSTTSLHPPNWTPFSNIFVGGSDYLCDALYAHIVAYNYVSGLCYRGIRLIELERPKSSHANQRVQQEALEAGKIPKKAATLLGLSDIAAESVLTPEVKEAAENQNQKMRRGTVPGLVHEPEPKPSAELHGDKNSLRDLQVALGGCIAKLVSALRHGEAGRVGTGSLIKGSNVPYIDPMFLRALCEIVRCAEGGCSKAS